MNLFKRYGITSSLTRYHGLVLLLLIFSCNQSYSQTRDQEVVKPSEKSYCEELYVKTDRDLYISGEKVWLKIYKLKSLTLTPEKVSKIVYIELLDADNNPVNQLKAAIDGFSGSAEFKLPDTLRTGNYFIRSYTNWMQNFSEDLFSYRRISVINPFKINDIKIPAAHQGADTVIFFPEGGNMVADMPGLIGFKSTGSDGEPVNISGAIINSRSDTLSHIKTDYEGYGLTTIEPSGNDRLFLVTRDYYGRTRKFKLPVVKTEGIRLSVPPESEKSPVLVNIVMSKGFAPADTNIYLVINATGLSGLKKKINLKREANINLLRKDMPSGLAHIMIVDGKETALADRWVYNEAAQSLIYHISIPKDSYSSREKIEMTITATDRNGHPAESDFSISVAKAVTVGDNSFEMTRVRQLPGLNTGNYDKKPSDINDYLLFYNNNGFTTETENKSLTDDPMFLPELEGHLISGNIRNRKSGEPIKNENISMSFVGKSALCQFAKTNEKGVFHFKTSKQGIREIVIQPLSEKITDYYVEMNNPFNPSTKRYKYGPYIPDTSRLPAINNVIISSQINNIYEPFTPGAELNTVSQKEQNFYGKPDNTILLSKYIELTSLREVVKEIIPGVTTVKKNDKINFKLYYQYQSKPFENNPLVLVDGVPVYDLEKVISINSKDMDKIDVFITRYYISDIVMDGILHFVTKKGNLDVIDLDRSVYRVEYDLPQISTKFYSPDYSTDKVLHDRIPDFRNTLYWKPDMQTDQTGKAEVEFYSSDESAEYTITIEGISSDGKTGSATMPLIIKNK
jgi:hypothetical protein